MADRKAVNRYHPPDFDPSKHGSINKYRNSHPLRERAKRLSEGILVIRFEMPYNIWCGGCGKHIGMGVRYNAEKSKVGNYYTTPIYRFRMKCHLCDHYFEMETNPMKCDYTIVTGATRKNQKWDMAENEQVLTEDRETVKKLAADPMFKLEHGVDDTKKLEAVAPTLVELEKTQTSWKDDFDQNRMLRKKFRLKKQELKASQAKDEALLVKSSLDIELVPEHEDDKKLASLLKYSAVARSSETQEQLRSHIINRSIFSSNLTPSMTSQPKTPPDKTPVTKLQSRKTSFSLLERLRASTSRKRPGGFGDLGDTSDKKLPIGKAQSGCGIIAAVMIGSSNDRSGRLRSSEGLEPRSASASSDLEPRSGNKSDQQNGSCQPSTVRQTIQDPSRLPQCTNLHNPKRTWELDGNVPSRNYLLDKANQDIQVHSGNLECGIPDMRNDSRQSLVSGDYSSSEDESGDAV